MSTGCFGISGMGPETQGRFFEGPEIRRRMPVRGHEKTFAREPLELARLR
jgi:hypothetical protein